MPAGDAEGGYAAFTGRSYDGNDSVIVAACIFFLAVMISSGYFNLGVLLAALKGEIVYQ